LNDRTRSIAVVIPARNEQETVSDIVAIAKGARGVTEVVVVNNASTDQTVEVARNAGATVVECADVGKAQAVAFGVSALKGNPEGLVLLDADLRGLTSRHFELLTQGLTDYSMVCGVLTSSQIRARILRSRRGMTMRTLTGQRALRMESVANFDWSNCDGYALEANLNKAFKRKPTHNIPMLGVKHTRREDKVKGLSKLRKFLTRVEVLLTYLRLWLSRPR
jgi:glycosyltransferase involved in cell wall biosynthesis